LVDDLNGKPPSTPRHVDFTDAAAVPIVHFGRMDENSIFGPFAVFLVRDGHTSAQCTGCLTRERAESVARDYLSTYDQTVLQEWECITLRPSDGNLVGFGPIKRT
jgi:hypothetical protein